MEEAWNSDLTLKIKEPLAAELEYLQDNILFTYLHLAGVDAALTTALLEKKTTAVAYETVEDALGGLENVVKQMTRHSTPNGRREQKSLWVEGYLVGRKPRRYLTLRPPLGRERHPPG